MLTPGRKRLVRHLCRDVRIVSSQQAASFLAIDGPVADPTRDLAGMVTADILRRDRVIARVRRPFTGPLARWCLGDPPPDMAAVAWQAQKSWDVAPEVLTVYRAGPIARRLNGLSTGQGPGNLNALGHDLACSELLLGFTRDDPRRADDWVGEDIRKSDQHGEKLPDAVLMDADCRPYLVCEVVGTYPKARLEAFHDYVATTLGLPYELW